MATIRKNLDNIIAQAIHGPKVDGIPLYSRVDGDQEIGFNKRKGDKSEKWEKASKNTFTSPTNIRRVFITGEKVIIQTYKPVIIRGKPDSRGTWREFNLSGDNNIRELSTKRLRYAGDMSKYYMEKQLNPDAEEPDNIIITGTGLRALSSPWVVSNLEEIYFDWTLLTSDNYRNAGIGCEEVLQSYINGKRGFVKSNLALEMFLYANKGDVKNIRKRYPRLKCVGFISELKDILGTKFDRGKSGIDSIEDSGELWSRKETNIGLIKQSNSLMFISQLTEDIGKYNTNFALRDGIYRFDRDILKKHFTDYEERVKEYRRQETNKPEKTKDDNIEQIRNEKSDLEKLLDKVSIDRNMADAKSILLLSLDGANMEEVNEVFESMSTAGEERYRKLVQ